MQPIPRKLSTHQQAVLIQVLLAFPEQEVGVYYCASASDALGYRPRGSGREKGKRPEYTAYDEQQCCSKCSNANESTEPRRAPLGTRPRRRQRSLRWQNA